MSKPASLPVRTLLAGGLLLVVAAPLAAQDVEVMPMGSMLMLKAGDVAVEFSLSSGPLTDDGNGGSSGDAVVVTPAKGTTLNGSPDAQSFEGIKKLKITLSSDNDLLHFVDFSFGGSITLHAGAGDDTVDYAGCDISGAQKLNGDDGEDSFVFGSSTCGKVTILGGDGDLTMDVTDCTLGITSVTGGSEHEDISWSNVSASKLRLILKQGDDTVQLTDVTVDEDGNLNLSTGNNLLTAVRTSLGDKLKVFAGNGQDDITFEDSHIGQQMQVNMGPGQNTLAFNSVAESMQVGEQLVIKGGPDEDTINFTDGADPGTVIQVGEFLRVSVSGGGNTLISAGELQVGSDLKYTGGSGVDHVALDGAGIGEDLTASLSGGNNDISLNDCVGTNLKITAGGGDDTVALTGSTAFSGKQTIKLGGGDNQGP